MRTIARLLLLTLMTAGLSAATVEELLREALAAETRLDAVRALQLYQQADAAKPGDAFIIQKIAKQYSDMVPDQTTDADRKKFAENGLKHARRSFELEPTNAVYALSLAICHGHLAMVADVRTKVEYSRLIKQEAERALQLDPNYSWAHHILGRWHYEVAELGGVARFFAKLLYGGIPPASVAEGVTHLTRATELEPGELNHWIDLGFAYAAAGKKAEARKSFAHGLAMPDRSKHDATSKKRAREGLKALE
jgi:tetratricopeptide (TPR) repeat protein